MLLDGEKYSVYVQKRPGIADFLEKMQKYFEIVIFTASLGLYADPLVTEIDPTHKISHRLFRESCTIRNNNYVKDLAHLGRELKNVIIVDNTPASYMLQPENGIPIASWFDNLLDVELFQLTPVLELLSNVQDVRKCIKKIVKDNKIYFNQALKMLKIEQKVGKMFMNETPKSSTTGIGKLAFVEDKKMPQVEMKIHPLITQNSTPNLMAFSRPITEIPTRRRKNEAINLIKPNDKSSECIPSTPAAKNKNFIINSNELSAQKTKLIKEKVSLYLEKHNICSIGIPNLIDGKDKTNTAHSHSVDREDVASYYTTVCKNPSMRPTFIPHDKKVVVLRNNFIPSDQRLFRKLVPPPLIEVTSDGKEQTNIIKQMTTPVKSKLIVMCHTLNSHIVKPTTKDSHRNFFQ